MGAAFIGTFRRSDYRSAFANVKLCFGRTNVGGPNNRPPPSGLHRGGVFNTPLVSQVYHLLSGTGVEPVTARVMVWCSTF